MSVFEIYLYLVAFFLIFLSNYFFVLYLLKKDEKIRLSLEEIKKKYGRLPKILFIIPAYNEEDSIQATIESIEKINYPRDKFWILVVDDGSKDKTFEKAFELTKKYNNLIVLKKLNGGKADALNYGLNYALKNLDFDFFAIIDADTYLDKNYPLLLLAFDERTLAVVPRILPRNDKNLIEKLQKLEYSLSNFLKDLFSYYYSWYIVNTGALVKKEALDIVGFFNKNSINEDLDYGLRIIEKGYKVKYLPDVEIKTDVPNTLRKLIKQRIRWFYGWFIHTLEHINIFKKDLFLLALTTFYYNLLAFLIIIILFLLRDFPKALSNVKYIDLSYIINSYRDFNIFEYIYLNLTNRVWILFTISLILALIYHFIIKKHNKVRISVIISYIYLAYYWMILAISQLLALINVIRRKKKWWR